MNNTEEQLSEQQKTLNRLQMEKFSRRFLLVLLIIMGIVLFNMIRIFLVPLLLAAVFTTLFHPLYRWLFRLFRENKGLSSFVCCLILLLGLLVPVYIIAGLVSQQAVNFYQSAEKEIRKVMEKGEEGPVQQVLESDFIKKLNLDFDKIPKIDIDWQSAVKDIAKTGGGLLATVINKTSQGTFEAMAIIFSTLFIMFYFFMDGEELIKRIMYLSPLNDEYEQEIMTRFARISRATVKGTLLIGLLQGTMGGLTLWIFGVGSPVLWGVVMVIFSIIPMVGAWVVMYPAAIIQIILGNVWQGIAIFIIGGFVIGNIDNLIRPRLVGYESGMHDLMIFFSTLGGIAMFGVMGFIVGPVIAALFLAILDIYSREFKPQLEQAQEPILSEAKDDEKNEERKQNHDEKSDV